MNLTLNWTIGSGAANQDVQYKLATDTIWITQSTVAGNVNTATINGLQDNRIYDLRIVTQCTGGTPSPSTVTQQVNLLCPLLTLTVTDTTVAYSFLHGGGSITAYTVHLLDSAGTTILQTQSPTVASTVSGTFSGLTQSTTYKVRITVVAGVFNKQCPTASATTEVTPLCNIPTGLTAQLIEDIPQE